MSEVIAIVAMLACMGLGTLAFWGLCCLSDWRDRRETAARFACWWEGFREQGEGR
jgi:hypothetical protein